MNIKIHSSELNRMMKTVSQCIDERVLKFGNIEISTGNNVFTIRGTDGQCAATTYTPLLGTEEEKFCIDGSMFAKACSICTGDITILTEGKFCVIKGNGRTRLPIVKAEVPEYVSLDGENPTVLVKAEDFSSAYTSVLHAISSDQSRIQLTGVLTEVDEYGLRMTSLDGFRMAVETVACDGDPMKVIIPAGFMKLIQSSIAAGETVKIVTDEKRIEASTDGMKITCGLLVGEFPDVARIIPNEFKTECIVNVEQIRTALRSSSVLNNKSNLVKITVNGNVMKVSSNSEQVDYEADVECDTHGNGLTIAFNQKYLTDAFASIDCENAIMQFNTPTSPCVIHGKDQNGIRLALPVRVAG